MFCAAPAKADITAEFQSLVETHGLAPASLTLLEPDGSTFVSVAVGQEVTDPAPVLSISKTLAGSCAIYAARRGTIGLSDSVSAHLGWKGPAGNATLGSLLTHSSGYRPDRMQRDVLGRNLDKPERIATLLARRESSDAGDPSYFYNNENYLVLEAAMSEVLGLPAIEWCLENVPELKAMVSLQRADGYSGIGMAGGLAVSTPDLAAYIHTFAVADDWPRAEIAEGIEYGPGIIMVAGRYIHRGGICLLTGFGHGAIAAKDAKGYALAFTYTGCPSEEAEAALQRILDAAIPDP